MTGPGGSNVSQACAACKHQRRKCTPDCLLAPFFPPHGQTEFLNAHRVFGVRNIMNTVKKAEPNRREIAVRCMIQEANNRAVDLAGGSFRIIKNLREQIDQTKLQLDLVLQQLNMYRAAAEDNEMGNNSFYLSQNSGGVFQNQAIQIPFESNNQLVTLVQPIKQVKPLKMEGSSLKKQSFESFQVVPFENTVHMKVSNIERNDVPHSEMGKSDLSSAEDIKPDLGF